MVDAALMSGTAHRRSVFELFARSLKGARRYGVVAGTGRFLEGLKQFRFSDEELTWLEKENFLRQETLDWLANYRFSGTIWGYPEGEVFFPGSPILSVESTFAEGVLLETYALSVLNQDSAVATAASRMAQASGGKPLAEMGSRRTGEYSAVSAARAAYLAGFSATSNLEAGRTYGVPTMGTAAHSFTLLHDTEREAFEAQIRALGTETTLLIDTFNIEEGVKLAIDVAGTDLGAVRIDSGDLPIVVQEVRRQLDALGATNTNITVTNDLDEFTVATLAHSPVDSFGVGTSVVIGSGSPTMGMVYKLVARETEKGEWVSVAKKSSGKHSTGGLKRAFRTLSNTGRAASELILVSNGKNPPHVADQGVPSREVMVPLVVNGEVQEEHLGKEGLEAARERHQTAVSELPVVALSLTRGDPAIPTIFADKIDDVYTSGFSDSFERLKTEKDEQQA